MPLKAEDAPIKILLAEDDTDDRFFFIKAIKEIPIATQLTTVNDGDELMQYLLSNPGNLPGLLFLDLSMPRKNGFECLVEIKENDTLKDITVVVFSTSYTKDVSYETGMINRLYKIGATNFIRKASDFAQVKQNIHDALCTVKGKMKG
jgi:CheY-like chemotaxis protein